MNFRSIRKGVGLISGRIRKEQLSGQHYLRGYPPEAPELAVAELAVAELALRVDQTRI